MSKYFGNGKTISGCIVVIVGAALKYLGYEELAELVMVIGGGTAAYGIAHKLEKLKAALK